MRHPIELQAPGVFVAVMIGVCLFGCGCSCGAAEEGRPRSQVAKSRSSTNVVEAVPAEPTEREPQGRLVAEFHMARGLSLRLEQREGRDEYAASVSVERKEGDVWKSVKGLALSLDPSCKPDADCRALREGGAFSPPAYVWPVKIGAKGTAHAECPCKECMKLQPGQYRLVAETCKGTHRLEGEPFWVADR